MVPSRFQMTGDVPPLGALASVKRWAQTDTLGGLEQGLFPCDQASAEISVLGQPPSRLQRRSPPCDVQDHQNERRRKDQSHRSGGEYLPTS